MPIFEDWERLKTDVQHEAERLITRAKGTVIKDRIEADLAAILRISDPTNDHELTARLMPSQQTPPGLKKRLSSILRSEPWY
jgi:hypothetical protein